MSPDTAPALSDDEVLPFLGSIALGFGQSGGVGTPLSVYPVIGHFSSAQKFIGFFDLRHSDVIDRGKHRSF